LGYDLDGFYWLSSCGKEMGAYLYPHCGQNASNKNQITCDTKYKNFGFDFSLHSLLVWLGYRHWAF
jgi:hypothetical protein